MIFLDLFLTFFKVGLFTFGGGYAMLPLIQDEVLSHGWMDLEQLVDFVAISESTPGPFAINVATYVGAETVMDLYGGSYWMGILGSACATLGVVLPSFIVILLVAKFYMRFRQSRTVSGAMYGLRAAVVGLMAAAAFGMLPTVFFGSGFDWASLLQPQFLCAAAIFGGTLVLALKKLSPILIVAVSAAAGILCGLLFL